MAWHVCSVVIWWPGRRKQKSLGRPNTILHDIHDYFNCTKISWPQKYLGRKNILAAKISWPPNYNPAWYSSLFKLHENILSAKISWPRKYLGILHDIHHYFHSDSYFQLHENILAIQPQPCMIFIIFSLGPTPDCDKIDLNSNNFDKTNLSPQFAWYCVAYHSITKHSMAKWCGGA